MRHFAKLFDFADQGQLLVQRVNSDDSDYEDAPYQLVLKTRNELGVQLEVTPGFASEERRDEEFDRFDEAAALNQFTNLQNALEGMCS